MGTLRKKAGFLQTATHWPFFDNMLRNRYSGLLPKWKKPSGTEGSQSSDISSESENRMRWKLYIFLSSDGEFVGIRLGEWCVFMRLASVYWRFWNIKCREYYRVRRLYLPRSSRKAFEWKSPPTVCKWVFQEPPLAYQLSNPGDFVENIREFFFKRGTVYAEKRQDNNYNYYYCK